ncbi:hypothetical protein BDW02DRAFT_599070 [Decorospora gaudefroyi]|uniref:Uncharacterized protein n=1 Tax=Decorospora gaudefroyi TaxID=184978 RepID=A0A6A5KB71_9PLEO|nr:hypothetical protein BDW02DRAFT_599070 [Decorospora gaudefroyi]
MANHTNNTNSPKNNSTGDDYAGNTNYIYDSYERFGSELEQSLFPQNDGDFASSFMNPGGANDELHRRPSPASPAPWADPVESWCYDGDRVYTGEGFVWAPHPQPGGNVGPGRKSRGGQETSEPGSQQASGSQQRSRNSRGLEASQAFGRLSFPGPQYLEGFQYLPEGNSENPNVSKEPAADASLIDPFFSDFGAGYSAALQGPTAGNMKTINPVNTFPSTQGPLGSPSQHPDPAYGAPSQRPAAPATPSANIKSNATPEPEEFRFIGWNDGAKMRLYRWKAKHKKGMHMFKHEFPGETDETLAAAWKEHKEEGKRLYDEWKAGQG